MMRHANDTSIFHSFTCTFDPVVMLISTATSFSLVSMFSDFFDFSINDEPLLTPPTARFFMVGDADNDDDFRLIDDWPRFDGDADAAAPFDFIESFFNDAEGVVTFALLSVNTFDILLMPSLLLRFWTLSKIL